MPDHQLAWIALNALPGIGPVIAQTLTLAFGSPEMIFSQDLETLRAQPRVGEALAQRLRQTEWKKLALAELEKCRKLGCRILTLADAEYPSLLRAVAFPPPVIYVQGSLLPEDEQALAVVGSRNPTAYGTAAARVLARELACAGFTIVSGLARGIDGTAHRAALAANSRTLAVVAHGLDQVYRAEHADLQQEIIAHGAVISEFPLGVMPLPGHFPRRNRIISGLAQGVLVIEAKEKSGALITARWAGEQGREVFALPGPFQSPLSKGTHALIQDGAKLVTSVGDILAELPVRSPGMAEVRAKPEPRELAPEHDLIRQALAQEAMHLDQLCEHCGKPVAELLTSLLTLELLGLVKSAPGPVYQWTGE